MNKSSRYSIRCDEALKERYKKLCKVANVSPSDIIQSAMLEFCNNTERILEMKDITELRNLLQEKVDIVEESIIKHQVDNK